jgi:polar amino acid transport system substrate-binding protein
VNSEPPGPTDGTTPDRAPSVMQRPTRRRRPRGWMAAAPLLGVVGLPGADDSSVPSTTTSASSEIELPAEFADGVVDVAIYDRFAPAAFVDDGELVGFVVDLTLALEDTLGVEFDLEAVEAFEDLIPGLQDGRFDLAPDLFYVTADRLGVVDLISMIKVGGAFVTAADSEVTIASVEDLCGLSVAAVEGYVFADELSEIGSQCGAADRPGIDVQTFVDRSACVDALREGRVDAYVGSADEVEYLVSTSEGLRRHPLVYRERLAAAAVPKGSALAEPIRTAIDALIADGTYATILEQWGVSELAIEHSEINPVES